ncbi:hypothetical protein DSM112329_00177 [Paraconexibacter sp. AEG42_29]|uniref:CopG family transcriptional regulator n=1 Tax=Paraconexibacter sp. AEG42_29 TaxID=2997339 RepID=A0AAU7ANZ1_9ACTN
MSHRVSITLDDDAFDALQSIAAARGLRPTTLAGEAVVCALGDQLHRPVPTDEETVDRVPTAASRPSIDEQRGVSGDERARWLELGRGEPWKRAMWELVRQLRVAYPDLAEALGTGWHHDRASRDGVLALAVWRAELDAGIQADPRLEHQWLAALRDFMRLLHDRQGHVGSLVTESERPTDW